MKINRRLTREVTVGSVLIGGSANITIQSMTNLPTANEEGNVKQICDLAASGCEIVRLAIATQNDAKSLFAIKTSLKKLGLNIPLVADVHFSPRLADSCLDVADKVRINAGNFSGRLHSLTDFPDKDLLVEEDANELAKSLKLLFHKAKSLRKPIRIGVNRGSLSPRIVSKFGNTDLAMWESARECLAIAHEIGFHDLVLSFKTSDTNSMIACNRFACQEMDKLGYNYPIHLGVTEAGSGEYGRIKSAIGIGVLLSEGIGDTIRVSLTEDPTKEIEVAKNILQVCARRRFFPEVISCPSCGRTSYNIQSVAEKIKAEATKLNKFFKIAVMGCAINGLREAADADFAIIGNPNGTLAIYKQGNCIKKNIPEKDIVSVFFQKIQG